MHKASPPACTAAGSLWVEDACFLPIIVVERIHFMGYFRVCQGKFAKQSLFPAIASARGAWGQSLVRTPLRSTGLPSLHSRSRE